MRVRQEGFSPTRVMARQFALCRLCPRGFEGPVVLLWKEIPVCQSCYIKELEAWNAKLNEVHGQQKQSEATSLRPADTCQGSEGDVYPRSKPASRPDIHGPQDKYLHDGGPLGIGDASISSQSLSSLEDKRDKTVDTQSQDWPNRKEAEVKSHFSSKSPDIIGGKE